MTYRKCRSELPKDTSHCSEYGAETKSGNAEAAANKRPDERILPAAVRAVSALILEILVICAVFLTSCGSKEPANALSEDDVPDVRKSAESQEAEDAVSTPPEEEIPLYSISDVDTIDIYAINRTPAQKAPGMAWDASLFYWLEDASREDLTDGYLSKCRISKTQLRSSESGELIQYEVYHDPLTGEIYKIVSIEEKEDHLLLTDYYYQNGIPNFVFVREDSVYTPTYATTDKTGERYYFAEDAMVQWRIIQTPREIEEYTLSPSAVSYRQHDYYQEEEASRNTYDDVELRMLNAAYNTYDAIASRTGIGVMEGLVKDTAGKGISGITIDIRRREDNVLLYRTVTDADGVFRFYVYLDGTECFLSAEGNEIYKGASAYGIFLRDSGITGAYGLLVLNISTGDEYPVHIHVYMAEDVRSGEDGSLDRNPAYDAVVSLREGTGAREGEIFRTLQAGEEGGFDTALPSGTYTAQIDVPGCARTFLEIRVEEGETYADGYVLPAPAEGTAVVVLTWECADMDVDLDLTLFTPFQSTAGDMAHVGGGTQDDGCGNYLVADNSSGCEVIYVNTAQEGGYKVYVSDYTDSQTGNYDADTLSRINIHIYIYDSSGLAAEYTFPAGQAGVVWEVAEISGSRITPSQRVYSRMEGKDWWLEKKQKKRLVRENYYENGLLNSWTEYSYDTRGNMTKRIHYNSDGSINGWSEHEYDSQGNEIKYVNYNGDGSIDSWSEKNYDNRGSLTKSVSYNGDGSISDLYEESYDSQGNLTVYLVSYSSDGSIIIEYERKFDNRGNETEYIQYSSDGSIWEWYECSYDNQDNEIKCVHYNNDGSISTSSRHERTYDNQGNEIKCVYYTDESIRQWYERNYDSQGNLISEVYYNNDGTVSEEYNYNSRGNATKYIRYYIYNGRHIIIGWTDWNYDNQGNLINEIEYMLDDFEAVSYSVRSEKSYDSRGNLIKSVEHFVLGDPIYYNEWTYDSQGYKVEEIHKIEDEYSPEWGSRTEYLYE